LTKPETLAIHVLLNVIALTGSRVGRAIAV
jgi:hypothetical protein